MWVSLLKLFKAHRWVSYLLAVALTLGFLWRVYDAGHENGATGVREQWAAESAQWQEKRADMEAQARRIDREHAAEVARLTTTYRNEVSRVESELGSTISALGTDNQRLRERFQRRPACPLPKADGAGPVDPGTGGTGLLESDEKFLIRFASEADQTAVRLKAAQDALKACRNAMTRSE